MPFALIYGPIYSLDESQSQFADLTLTDFTKTLHSG